MIDSLLNAVRRNPYPVYRVLRRVAPVLRHPRLDLWMLFDHESVKRAMQDHDAFSSRAAPPGGGALDWLIFQDPPVHTRLRGLIARTFTPRAIARLEPAIAAAADALLENVSARGELELMAEFAVPLPLLVIGELLGVSRDDHPALRRWSEAILQLGDAVHGGDRAARAMASYRAAKAEMEPYVARLIAERRIAPRADLLTRLAEAELEGSRLGDLDILNFFQLLLLAGTETTSNLIGNAVISFLEAPAQLQRVREAPELLPAALEEVLRYRAPLQLIFRQTVREVQVRGKTIPAGKLVLAMVGSANRDGEQFTDPERFNIHREPTPHLAFGHGMHFCIGAALARIEARVAMEALLRLPRGFRLARTRWEPQHALSVYGPKRLHIRFD